MQTTVGWRLITCCHIGTDANLGWDVSWRLTPGMLIAACSSRSASSLLPSASSSWALTLAYAADSLIPKLIPTAWSSASCAADVLPCTVQRKSWLWLMSQA